MRARAPQQVPRPLLQRSALLSERYKECRAGYGRGVRERRTEERGGARGPRAIGDAPAGEADEQGHGEHGEGAREGAVARGRQREAERLRGVAGCTAARARQRVVVQARGRSENDRVDGELRRSVARCARPGMARARHVESDLVR